MGFDRVFGIQHRCNTPLGIAGAGFEEVFLGNQPHRAGFRKMQSQGHPRQPTAYNQHIKMAHLGVPSLKNLFKA